MLLAIIIVIVSIVVVLNLASKQGQGVRGGRSGISRPSAPLRTPPACLGVPEGHPARPAAERLEAALTPDFEARVKDRVLRHAPSMREGEWQWRWFELKRYFLMCGVLRGVPMYSSQVDDVWHEMLMFTREYEQFCKQFCGQLIHHAPHEAGAKPDRGERAWFDWIYGELFLPASGSARLWGAFYRTPMPRERMRELETRGADELRAERFNAGAAAKFPDLAATIDYLIGRGRKLAAVRDTRSADGDSDWTSTAMMTGMLSTVFFASSWGPEESFRSEMEQHQSEEELRQGSGGGCGSSFACGGGAGADNNGSDNNGGDSGSCGGDGSSGGGSCSGGSDGGSSCGSSCGGGGD
ncbi:hypothetical protein GXP70_28505 [Paenibacillus lycopersici]|uniref:Uncharacterized protein n=1 Tax=Paenibacillus lycopersici TaxID=2704462 RepID=A0A6C0G3P0_9BACL|nr:hypothetical protein [Paenibacillus lycopersici]QHT63507.1 hypothetical protein GXP70_28505 [Paenibacillus lycopersici]